MRAVMQRLRSLRLRSNLLPLLLAVFVLRALIPAGFMPGSAVGMSLSASMCSTQPGKSETLEFPGTDTAPHCEYCVAPLLGAPLAPVCLEGLGLAMQQVSLPRAHSQIPESLLARAQSARAPPHA
jgi:hypothetical protein